MIKRLLAVYMLMLVIFLGMTLLEWSRPSGMAVVDTGPQQSDAPKSHGVIEITVQDFVSSFSTFDAERVSVMGVMLGDTLDGVLGTLGNPDRFKTYPGDGYEIVNLEYGESLGSRHTALLVHLEDDKVTRITVYPGFGEYLVGDAKLGYSKEQVYARFGSPDHMEPLKDFWVYSYYDEGVDVLLKVKKVIGYSFYYESLY